MSTKLELARVVRECARWNVPILFGKPTAHERTMEDFHEGPRYGGIHWPTRTIWYPLDSTHKDAPMALLHELSHVLCDVEPELVDELESMMLKFEQSTARRLKLQWASWMEDYELHGLDGERWPDLTTAERGEILRHSMGNAVMEGILYADGRPTYMSPEGLVNARANWKGGIDQWRLMASAK